MSKTIGAITDPALVQILDKFVDRAFLDLGLSPQKDLNNAGFKPIALAFSDEKIEAILCTWSNDETKVKELRELGEKCYNEKLPKIALINDAVYKVYNQVPDPITDLPLSYPPGMRQECLMLLFIDFKDHKNNFISVHPYSIENGTIIRGKDVQIFNNDLKAMDSLMMSNISFGFTKAAMMDVFQEKEITHEQLSIEQGDRVLKEVLNRFPGATLGMNILEGHDTDTDTEELDLL